MNKLEQRKKYKIRRKLSRALIALTLTMPFSAFSAIDDLLDFVPDTTAVPIYFIGETWGHTVGVGGALKGVGQPQAGLIATGLRSFNGSYLTYFSAINYKAGEHWLIGGDILANKLTDNPYQTDGSNDSELNVTRISDGFSDKYRLSFRYILPWGVGKKGADAVFNRTRETETALPTATGLTIFEIEPFYSSEDIVVLDNKEEAKGFVFLLDWDNRNDTFNSSEGSRTSIQITHAPDWLNENNWNTISFQNSQYFDIGSMGNIFDKQILAFSFHTADTPSWDKNCDNGNSGECGRPPKHEQNELGGLFNLRSFSGGRYYDRSSIHYSAEYRATPNWQPINDLPGSEMLDVAWWQWVAFLDMGRVADEYNLKTLHTDMKWSAGGSLRFQVKKIVVRFEASQGNEGIGMRAMVNQPF